MSGKKVSCYFVRKAGASGRRTWGIARKFEDGSTEQVSHSDLDNINDKYVNKEIRHAAAEKAVYDLKERLWQTYYRKQFSSENLKLLEEYWEEVYSHKELDAPAAAYNRLRRAIEALGSLNLMSASAGEIAKQIKTHSDQRRVAAALNQMLKYFGRPREKIPMRPKPARNPKYLSEPEVKKVIPKLDAGDDEYTRLFKLLVKTAFATGCRIGELFALDDTKFKGRSTVWVNTQRREDWTEADLKNHKPRHVVIIGGFEKAVHEWAEVDEESKWSIRNIRHAEILTAACKKVWPKNPKKHLKFHDLRHSYAIHMLHHEVSISQVARLLGDGIAVTEEYYTGFTLTDEGVQSVLAKLKGR